MHSEGSKQFSSHDSTERLRLIVEHEQGRPISYDEAQELGEALINFFEVLAEEIHESAKLAPLEV